MPGIMGGIIGALSAGFAPDVVYGEDISVVFPMRGGENGRSAGYQACNIFFKINDIFRVLNDGIISNSRSCITWWSFYRFYCQLF